MMKILIDKKSVSNLKNWFSNYLTNFKSDNSELQRNIKLKEDHTRRIVKEILDIGKALELNSNELHLAEIIALLHDIGDYKITGSEETQIELPRKILLELKVDKDTITQVVNIIDQISFHKGIKKLSSIEAEIVQDADRLEAIGAIGIARAFAYGGAKGREIWNPEDKPKIKMNKEEYMNNRGSSINHFYEKLMLLKDQMNTETGKKIAQERHQFMEIYLEQFYGEWEGSR